MSAAKIDNTALTREALNTVHGCDQAIYAHTAWLRQIHESLICCTPVEGDTLLEDAHRHCGFGQWFYGGGMEVYRADEAYQRIRGVHRDMHGAARILLSRQYQDPQAKTRDYARFMDLVVLFKQEIRNFQYHLISRVCTVDHLTGAWNRHAMSVKLAEEYERTQRTCHPCALSMMDLDHFKRINDEFGHPVGDETLRMVTSLVNGELRRNDSLCRFGGEEFLILMPNTGLAEAGTMLNRIRQKLETTVLTLSGGRSLVVTASFGVASLLRDEPPEDVLEQADHALLAAKAQGRNRVCMWDMEHSRGT